MRTQPEPATSQRKWGQTTSYLGRTAGRSKLDNKAGWVLFYVTIEHCWVIVPDKRATFLKNSRRYTQILDPSEEGKLIEESAVAQTTV